MKTAFVVLLGLSLCGCTTLGMSPAQLQAQDQQSCEAYGYRPRTDAYAQCMQSLDMDRQADNQRRVERLADGLDEASRDYQRRNTPIRVQIQSNCTYNTYAGTTYETCN